MDTESCDSGLPESSRSSENGELIEMNEEVVHDEKGMCGLTELVSHCLSRPKPEPQPHQPFLCASLFTGVPPTIRFYTKGTKVTKPSRKISSRLTWCHNSLLPIVMRQSLAASHFTIVDESLFYIGYWGRHLKSMAYRSMKPFQKINHFPGAFHIGRKDRLWIYISKMKEKFGDDFDVLPTTYLLPAEKEQLAAYLAADKRNHVIIKPPASARGTGITVTRKMTAIPDDQPVIAQHYIDRPLTINGAKFDLRLYAYCPSLEPLRIYIYDQGLVRFASVPYSKCTSTLSNKYMHLTNYSINKLAEQDGVSDSPVPKWTLTELWRHLDALGYDAQAVRHRIHDVIVKAFISCEKPIRDHMAKHVKYGFICHELFGVDILLDEDLKPWLLEFNISPSLHSGTPLDISVKAPLAKDVLNMAGIYVPPSTDDGSALEYRTRPRNGPKTSDQLVKEKAWVGAYRDDKKLNDRILRRLTPEDTRILVEFEDELRRKGNFQLVFPTTETVHYLDYFTEPVYANLLLQQWQLDQAQDREVGINRLEQLCRQGHMGNAIPKPNK